MAHPSGQIGEPTLAEELHAFDVALGVVDRALSMLDANAYRELASEALLCALCAAGLEASEIERVTDDELADATWPSWGPGRLRVSCSSCGERLA